MKGQGWAAAGGRGDDAPKVRGDRPLTSRPRTGGVPTLRTGANALIISLGRRSCGWPAPVPRGRAPATRAVQDLTRRAARNPSRQGRPRSRRVRCGGGSPTTTGCERAPGRRRLRARRGRAPRTANTLAAARPVPAPAPVTTTVSGFCCMSTPRCTGPVRYRVSGVGKRAARTGTTTRTVRRWAHSPTGRRTPSRRSGAGPRVVTRGAARAVVSGSEVEVRMPGLTMRVVAPPTGEGLQAAWTQVVRCSARQTGSRSHGPSAEGRLETGCRR